MSKMKYVAGFIVLIIGFCYRNDIIELVHDCRIRELFVDAFDQLWACPPILRYAVVMLFLALLFVTIYKLTHMILKGGETQNKYCERCNCVMQNPEHEMILSDVKSRMKDRNGNIKKYYECLGEVARESSETNHSDPAATQPTAGHGPTIERILNDLNNQNKSIPNRDIPTQSQW